MQVMTHMSTLDRLMLAALLLEAHYQLLLASLLLVAHYSGLSALVALCPSLFSDLFSEAPTCKQCDRISLSSHAHIAVHAGHDQQVHARPISAGLTAA